MHRKNPSRTVISIWPDMDFRSLRAADENFGDDAACFGGLRRLAVDDRSGSSGFASVKFPHARSQSILETRPLLVGQVCVVSFEF